MEPITEEVAATAMCLWEAYLEDVRPNSAQLLNLHKLKERIGTVALRRYLLDVASAVESEYSANPGLRAALESHSWDWDVLPVFLQKFDARVIPSGQSVGVDSHAVFRALRDAHVQLDDGL